MYDIAIIMFSPISPFQKGLGRNKTISTATTATNIARILYSLPRKVFAPFLMSTPILSTSGLEDGWDFTQA